MYQVQSPAASSGGPGVSKPISVMVSLITYLLVITHNWYDQLSSATVFFYMAGLLVCNINGYDLDFFNMNRIIIFPKFPKYKLQITYIFVWGYLLPTLMNP